MFNIFKRSRKANPPVRRNVDSSTTAVAKSSECSESESIICSDRAIEDTPAVIFSNHMSKYVGNTVTILVSGGGYSGSGFTGILLHSNSAYVRLLTRTGPIPNCSVYNSCARISIPYTPCFLNGHINQYSTKYGFSVPQLGSIAYIQTNKIVGFVHIDSEL